MDQGVIRSSKTHYSSANKEFQFKDAELAPTEVRAEDVIEADDGVMTSESALLSDEKILEEFRERDSTVMEVDDDSDEDDSEERPQKPARAQITEAINTLSSYSLFAADGADEIRRNMNQIAYIIEKNICNLRGSSQLTAF
ncbi:hypothetical protein AWC38_SpisGene4936 [Stylophora pistillata]|uniref:Uncharacterized protein n=1 Tax=Stylophora pistillata TaxID=50429 RepID=A0A2B4SK44_STYPI|nr:hypothetical protein AWC38_SpisGene4936 [Stylophora pistillata]